MSGAGVNYWRSIVSVPDLREVELPKRDLCRWQISDVRLDNWLKQF